MLLSICTITYGHEKFISQTIESVLNQITDFDIEFIIANDNSPDETDRIVKEYICNHPKGSLIKYIKHKKNLGMMPNFVFALQQCKGKYIALCEGDDYWTDSLKLQKQVDFLETNVEYSGCAHQSMILINNTESHVFKKDVPEDLTVNNLIEGRLFHTASVVFRKSVLDSMGKMPNVHSGDRLINLSMAISGKIRFFDECMGIYRIHNSGASSNSDIKQMLLDLNSIAFLKNAYPNFPVYRYKSYIYATVGLLKNISIHKKVFYLFLSFFYSFSNFPDNLRLVINHFLKR